MADEPQRPGRGPLPPAETAHSKLVTPADGVRSDHVPPPSPRRTGDIPAPEQHHPGAIDEERDTRITLVALIAVLSMVVLSAIAFAVVTVRSNDGVLEPAGPDGVETEDSAAEDTAVDDSFTPAPTSETATTSLEETEAAGPDPAGTDGPFVEISQRGSEVTLIGSVPDEGLVEQLQQAAEIAYSPLATWNVGVDAAAGPAEWLAASPRAIVLLQMITEGTIRLSDEQITISGTAPSQRSVDRLERALIDATGLPVQVGDMEITGKKPPIYVIAASDGQAALSGVLPSEEIRQGLVGAAVEVYGEDNVVDATTVDTDVYPVLWMYNGGPLVQALSQFPDYEIRLDDRLFSGSLSGGAVFDTDSAEITPAFAQVLNFGVSVLTRDPFIDAEIEGHTDDRGDTAYNLQLSQDRADAVVDYVAQRGIEPSRLTAIGRGEAEPIEPNDTPEGQARNRRVEITLIAEQ